MYNAAKPINERSGKETLLHTLIAHIARARWTAVTYHPDDPNRADIEAAAAAHGLDTAPDASVTYRTVRGCHAAPADTTPTIAAALHEFDPTDDRLWRRAEAVAAHLARHGWHLIRVRP